MKEIVNMIEILKLLQSQKDFGLLEDSLNKIKNFKVNEIKNLVKNIIQIKRYDDRVKYLEMQKTISTQISSILNDNKMTTVINEVKRIMSKYNTHDLSMITKLQKRDDIRLLATVNVALTHRPTARKQFCMLYQV